MSFDIFLQRFIGGDGAGGGGDEALQVLVPYLERPPQDGWARVRTADGEADVYGLGGDGLMINHASGAEIGELMVQVARAARWAIIPVGCSACVVDTAMISDLPAELRESAVVVTSGADLRRVIRSA